MRQTGKIIGLFAVLVLLCSVFPRQVQAEPDKNGCRANGTHEWELTQTITQPTCESEGSGWYVCKHCGVGMEGSIPMLDHAWDQGTVIKAATCTEKGQKMYSCMRISDHKRYEDIPALGHSWDAGTVTKEATCTASGEKTYTCKNDKSHKTTETIPALGHSYGDWTRETEPTCTSAGRDVHKCTRCGNAEYREVAALGHSWDAGTVTKAATCKEEGVKTFKCTACGTTKTEAIPKTDHTVETLPAKEATCKEEGLTEGQKCSVCGEILKNQEIIPKLEHEWDEGVVKEPETALLHDKEIVYTCKKCGETRTETAKIEASNFWSTLYKPTLKNLPDEIPSGEPVSLLYISEQPKDLEIEWEEGNTGMLTIKAAGGTGEYTYYWTLVPDCYKTDVSKMGHAFIEDIVQMGFDVTKGLEIAKNFGKAESGGNAISSSKPPVKGSFTIISGDAAAADDIAKILGDDDNTKTLEYELLPAGAVTTVTDVPELQVEVGSTEGYTAWCTVYDESGEHVKSNKVKIYPALKIIQQPQNVNFDDPEAFFTIQAAYGKEPYQYQWAYAFTEEDTYEDIEVSDAPDAQTDSLVPLYWFTWVRCTVTDAAGKSVTSEPALLYTAPVLELSTAGDVLIRPGEEASVSASFTGGEAPYTASWTKAGGDSNALVDFAVETEPAGDEYTYVLDTTDESVYGDYVFTVVDSLGQTKEAVVNVSYRDLTIVKQPEGGQLDMNGNCEVSIEIGEGTMPFTYSLREVTHEEIASETTGSAIWSQTLHESMLYYIYVEDANGLHAESDYFWVGNYEVMITSQPERIEIKDPHYYTEADLLIQGGEGPYKLTWFKLNEETGNYEKIEYREGYAPTVGYGGGDSGGLVFDLETANWARLLTSKTGTYILEATDANNIKGVSKPIEAVYTGTVPYFTVQPQGAEYEATHGRSQLEYTLDVEAVTGSGDYVYYNWEYLNENGGWSRVPRQTMYSRNAFEPGWADYPHQLFRNVDHSRLYRCKATNKKTGEYSYSEPAYVKLLMSCSSAGQSGTDTAVWGEFIGGAWPFTFELRQVIPPGDIDARNRIGTDKNNRSYTVGSFIDYPQEEEYMNNYHKDEFGNMQFSFATYMVGVPCTEKWIAKSNYNGAAYCSAEGVARRYRFPYDVGGDDNSDTPSGYSHRIYQMMIIDRFGETCTSEWFRMTSPMTTGEKIINFIWYGLFGLENVSEDHNGW